MCLELQTIFLSVDLGSVLILYIEQLILIINQAWPQRQHRGFGSVRFGHRAQRGSVAPGPLAVNADAVPAADVAAAF